MEAFLRSVGVSYFLGIALLTLINVPFGISISLPSVAVPSLSVPTSTASSSIGTVNSYSSGISNAACEANPTALLCNTSVATGHKIIQNFPANTTIRPCSVFLGSPHCCAQFCLPGTGGNCDAVTGACFCNPAGVPNVCQLLMQSDTTQAAGMNANDYAVLNICRQKCLSNPNNCTRAAAATDGIVGTVCFCYCDP